MSAHNICFYGEIRKILPGYHPHIWSYEPTVLLVLQWGSCLLSLLICNPSNKISRLKKAPNKAHFFNKKY